MRLRALPGSIVALVVLLLALTGTHLWWLARYRRGFPLDIDESGYLWFAVTLQHELRDGGPLAVFDRFQGEGWVGPLLPTVTALLQAPTSESGTVPAMAVQLGFLAVLVLAAYGIGRHLLDRRAGLLAAVLAATAPATIDFVRTYHLVIPSAATYAAATYALLASNRLRRTGWSVAWGLALGLTLLSRGMMIAFVPALLAAAGWILVVDRADRRRLLNAALGIVALVAVGLLWYASSWRPIFDYLLDFGYGDASPGRASGRTPFSFGYWTDELVGTIDLSLYLPLATVLAAAVVATAVASGRLLRVGARGAARAAVHSDAVVPAFVVLEGYLALTSSSNDGTGFAVPLLAPAFALVSVAVLRLPWRALRVTLVAALCAVAAFDVVMKADVLDFVSRPQRVDVPVLGRTTLVDGRGFLHQHLVNDACYELGPPARWLPASERGWLVLFDVALAPLDRVAPLDREPRTYLTLKEPVVNASALRLAALRAGRRGGVFDHVETRGDDSVGAYRRFLAEREPDVLLTGNREGCHFGPAITPARVEAAAASLGFRVVRRIPMPDGRALHVWARSAS